jgi:CubicO group peptidase (beta-lactamase class C family)
VTETPQQLEGLDEFISQTIAAWKVPGVAVAVIKDGETIFAKGFGYRDVEKKLPVTPDTIFAIGSATKAFAAASVGLMVDDGKLEWDKPVKNYLPTFKLHDPFATERMSPRDLLCHRSGLPRHDLMWYNSPFSRKQIFDRMQYLEPSRDFRTHFQYQNLMYMTAGYLAGEVDGTSWESVVRQRIFEPLEMTNSNFSVEESQKTADFALPYREKDDVVKQIPFRNITEVGPAGSINSSVAQMVNWARLQLNKGKHGETQVISESALKHMHSPQMTIEDPIWTELFQTDYVTYGLGWFIQPFRGHTLIHHGGNIDGFSAFVSFMPDQNTGVIVLTNLNSNFATQTIAFNIYDRLLGLNQIDWNGKFKAVVDKLKAAQKEGKEKSDADRKPDTHPSHDLDSYVGEYEHPGYGVFSITKNRDGLVATINAMSMAMGHYHYDIFEVVQEEFDIRFKVFFTSDVKGNIDRLAIQLEPAVKELVFARMPDKSMNEAGFLVAFVGKYELMPGMVLEVILRDMLIVAVPGQPNAELVPYQGTTFNIKGAPGFSIEFKGDEAVVTQPNGVFVAKKLVE